VFAALLCLYALSSGGQGYSVDGTFSYEIARSIATDPARTFLRENVQTLRRWGPVTPALAVPLVWLGARVADLAPPRDSVRVGGQLLRLRDWPALSPEAPELRLPLAGAVGRAPIDGVRVVSFLSLSTHVPDGQVVAEAELADARGVSLDRAPLRAGRESAEWAYDVPGPDRPAHAKAAVAGHLPGNPDANLYWADLPLRGPTDAAAIVLRLIGGEARFHVRAIAVNSGGQWIDVTGPARWTDADQTGFFTRFAFSFVNVPAVALLCALLVPLGRALGYDAGTSGVLALAAGVTTPLWPYAKHDFSEPVAALAMVGATLIAVRQPSTPWALALAGTLAAAAAGARYTAAWLLPILVVQVALTSLANDRAPVPQRLRRALTRAASLCAVPAAALVVLLAGTRQLPTIWGGAVAGLTQGWLDFSPWNGTYGLLLSPGKGLLWYAPALALGVGGASEFIRRHGTSALVFVALPLAYLLTYASKGVWHGGGWGPRYLVPALPFLACLALPVVERTLRSRRSFVRWGCLALCALSAGVQLLGVAKHPNLYTVMFRDHVAPALSEYGRALGGPPADAYWQHFGGPGASRQLVRPPAAVDSSGPRRGLGYAYSESGPLTLDVQLREAAVLSFYACDWDHRGRRQRVLIQQGSNTTRVDLDHDFSRCEYDSVPLAGSGQARVVVEALQPNDVPVLSALFFDRTAPSLPSTGDGAWVGRVGSDGYALFGWQRGADVASLPPYVAGFGGGQRVWIDTWEAELTDTALLYAPGFSPLLAHAWLLGADAVSGLMAVNQAAIQRALASPPWRYVEGIEIHAPNPEYGLGLDFWPLLMRSQFRSHRDVMLAVWAITAVLAAGLLASAAACLTLIRRAVRDELRLP
jgi:hypothetical protein